MSGVPPPTPTGKLPLVPPTASLTSADFLFGPSGNDEFSIPNNVGGANFLGFAIPTIPSSAPEPPDTKPKTSRKRPREDDESSQQPTKKARKSSSKKNKKEDDENADAEQKRRDKKRKREEKKKEKARKKVKRADTGEDSEKKDRKSLSKEERRELKKKKKEERKKLKRELEKEKRLKKEREREESSRGNSTKGKSKSRPQSKSTGTKVPTNRKREEEKENSDEEMDERAFEADMAGEAERNKEILKQFSKDQLDRYHAYKTATYPKKQYAKKRMVAATGRKVADSAPVVMMAITKVHIGELIVMEERGVVGKILPEHIREAYRRLADAGKMPYLTKKPFFRH